MTSHPPHGAGLDSEQEHFMALACAFLDTSPPQEEIDKLLTLAALLLPEPAVQLLRTRAAAARPLRGDPRGPLQ